MKSKKINIVIIALSIVLLLAYVIMTNGFGSIVQMIVDCNKFFLLCAFLMIVLYWVLEAEALHLLVKKYYGKQRFRSSFKVTMVGQFFNCVTPFSSGGQPMQAYSMMRSGIPLGISSCTLLVKFIVFQTVLTLYSLAVLVFKFKEFSGKISGFGYLILIGFLVNLVVVIALFCIGFLRNFTLKVASWFIRLLSKLHLLKDPKRSIDYIKNELTGFHESFSVMRKHRLAILEISLLTVAQLTFYYLIPYFLYLSFGLRGASVSSILSAQSFVHMVSSFIPLPGAVGGAELSFHTFFGLFFPPDLLSMSILFWRIITFYLPIIVGLFFVFRVADRKNKAAV